jgi:hypothetical protein
MRIETLIACGFYLAKRWGEAVLPFCPDEDDPEAHPEWQNILLDAINQYGAAAVETLLTDGIGAPLVTPTGHWDPGVLNLRRCAIHYQCLWQEAQRARQTAAALAAGEEA